jgi:type IV secretion system protein VirB9
MVKQTLIITTTLLVAAQAYAGELPVSNSGAKALETQMPLIKALKANTPEKIHAIPGVTPNPNWALESNHPTTRKALKLNNKWRNKDTEVTIDDETGTLTYQFGAAEHLVVCAPLRYCTITLEPGEKLLYPALADQERWDIGFTFSGQPNLKTTHITLKPQRAGLRTSLVLTTDKRLYTLRLLSDEERYMNIVNFAYSDASNNYMDSFAAYQQQWSAYTGPQTNSATAPPTKQTRQSDYELDVDNLYFGYDVKGDNEIKPIRVFDDGVKTHIEFDPKIQELPSLVIVTGWRKKKIVEIKNHNGYEYIVNALFEKANLITGVGWSKKKIVITRDDPIIAN